MLRRTRRAVACAIALAGGALGCGSDEVVQVEWSDARAIVAIDLDGEDRVLRVSAYEHGPNRATRIEASEGARTVVLGFARPLSDYGIDAALLGATRAGANAAPLPPPDHALERDGATGRVERSPTAAQLLRAREAVPVPRKPCDLVRPVSDQPLVEWPDGRRIEFAVPYARRSAVVGSAVRTGTDAAFRVERVVASARTPITLRFPTTARILQASGVAEASGTVWLLSVMTDRSAVVCRVPIDAQAECTSVAAGVLPAVIDQFAGARWDGRLELWALGRTGELARAVEVAPGGTLSWTTVRPPTAGGVACRFLTPALTVLGAGRVVAGGPGGKLEAVSIEDGATRRETVYEAPTFIGGDCVAAYVRLQSGFEALLRRPVESIVTAVGAPEVQWRRGPAEVWAPLTGLEDASTTSGLLSVDDQLVLVNTGARVLTIDPLRPDLRLVVCPSGDGVSGAVIVARAWEDELLLVASNSFGTTSRLGWFELEP